MQSHTPSFIFGPNFNFGTTSLFGTLNTEMAQIVPPVEICYILSETGNFLITENDNNNIIMEICSTGFVLTEPGDYVLTQSGGYVLVE